MFLYLDSSALVKRYIERGIATSAISRVDEGIALARAARGNRLDALGARPRAVRRRLAGLWQGTRYRQPSHSRRETRLEARGCGHTMPYSSQHDPGRQKRLHCAPSSPFGDNHCE